MAERAAAHEVAQGLHLPTGRMPPGWIPSGSRNVDEMILDAAGRYTVVSVTSSRYMTSGFCLAGGPA